MPYFRHWKIEDGAMSQEMKAGSLWNLEKAITDSLLEPPEGT